MKAKFRSIIFAAAMGIAFALSHPLAAYGEPMMGSQFPGSYVWDGSEFVGMVGNDYYYLGPGDIWMPMDPPRERRFTVWRNGHPHWQNYAVPNTRYRTVWHAPPPPPVVSPPMHVSGSRSGGPVSRRVPRSQRFHTNPNTNPYMIPRLKPSPGGPAYWH